MMVVNTIRIEDHRTREHNNNADEFKNSIISSMLNVLLFDRGIKYEFLHWIEYFENTDCCNIKYILDCSWNFIDLSSIYIFESNKLYFFLSYQVIENYLVIQISHCHSTRIHILVSTILFANNHYNRWNFFLFLLLLVINIGDRNCFMLLPITVICEETFH